VEFNKIRFRGVWETGRGVGAPGGDFRNFIKVYSGIQQNQIPGAGGSGGLRGGSFRNFIKVYSGIQQNQLPGGPGDWGPGGAWEVQGEEGSSGDLLRFTIGKEK